MKEWKFIEIEWVDSVGTSNVWNSENSFDFASHDRSMIFRSCGYFIKKTKTATYLCQSKRVNKDDGGQTFGELFAIPNKAILKTKIGKRK